MKWLFLVLLNLTAFAECNLDEKFLTMIKNNVPKEVLDKAGYSMTILEDNKTICETSYNGDQPRYPASSIKTAIAIAVLRKIDLGFHHFDDDIKITQSNADAECDDECAKYGFGKYVKLGTLIYDMIAVSNNIATNQIIDLVSKDYINYVLRSLSIKDITIYRKVYAKVDPEPSIKKRNTATPNALNWLYKFLILNTNNFLKYESRRVLLHLLAKDTIEKRLSLDFPTNYVFYHKTGSTSITSSDAGFTKLQSGRFLIISALQEFHDKPNYLEILRKVGLESLHLAESFSSIPAVNLENLNWN